jgi:RNA polymerase sigma-70 factor (ECF subfamily)
MEKVSIPVSSYHSQKLSTVTDEALYDEAAFNEWVTKTQKALVRFCRQFVGDWSEAEDMAQEAYIRAWQKRSSFKGTSSLLTWQMSIARRVCLDRLRNRKKVSLVPLDERDITPECNIITKIDVQCALEKLSIDDRVILYLRVGEDMPFEDIAKVLGRTSSACRKRFERAKLRFEAAYSGMEEHNGKA